MVEPRTIDIKDDGGLPFSGGRKTVSAYFSIPSMFYQSMFASLMFVIDMQCGIDKDPWVSDCFTTKAPLLMSGE